MQAENVAKSYTMNNFHTLYTEAMEIRKVFASNLFRLREERGMSAKELGKKVGVTAKHIYDMEKERRSPSIELLDSIAKEFGVAKSSLLEKEPPMAAGEERVIPVSKMVERIVCVPDDIFEKAFKVGDTKDPQWDTVRSALDIAIARNSRKEAR